MKEKIILYYLIKIRFLFCYLIYIYIKKRKFLFMFEEFRKKFIWKLYFYYEVRLFNVDLSIEILIER